MRKRQTDSPYEMQLNLCIVRPLVNVLKCQALNVLSASILQACIKEQNNECDFQQAQNRCDSRKYA